MYSKILFGLCVFFLSLNLVFASEKDILNISSKNVVAMEVSTGRVLFSKRHMEKTKIASTTKIMTCILALENCSLEEMCKISKKAAGIGGSTVGLKSGTEVKLKSLLYGLMLESGNDCAIAVAEHIAGSSEEFATIMNEKAKLIGAKHTKYTNPHGLDTEANCCTAYDLALITRYAIQNEEFNKIISTESITLDFAGVSKYLSNTNRLLRSLDYCDGGKTGFTNGAMYCLMMTGSYNGMRVIVIVLGAPSSDIRFSDGKKVMNYCLENYTLTDISDIMRWYIDIPVYKGNIKNYVKNIQDTKILPLKEGEKESIYIKQSILPIINPPQIKGFCIGYISMHIGEECIYTKDVYLEENIYKNTVLDYIKMGIKTMFELELKLF